MLSFGLGQVEDNDLREVAINRICKEYANAYSTKDTDLLSSIFKPDTTICYHSLVDQSGKSMEEGKDVCFYNGSLLQSIINMTYPMSYMYGTHFINLVKLDDYSHSEIKLLGIKLINQNYFLVNTSIHRYNSKNIEYYSRYSIYALEKLDDTWFINEAWLYDNNDQETIIKLDLENFK